MNRLLTETTKKYNETGLETAFKAEPPATLFRMYSDFCSQWKAVRGPFSGPWLNMVLAYEDFQAGVHGFQICRDLFDAVDQELGFGFRNAWRFDFLRNSRLRDKAIAETICADMVVISAHAPGGGLPPAAKWWLETALEQREGDPGALVLLLDGVPEGTGTPCQPIESYLIECAQKGGMELFIKRVATRCRPGQSGAGRLGNQINLPELHNWPKLTIGRNSAAAKEEPDRLSARFEPCARELQRGHFQFSSARMGTR